MRILTASLLALGVTASAASASSISVGLFSVSNYNSLLGGLDGLIIGQDFETYAEANVGGVGSAFETNVGDFETLGGTGSGGTVTNADNTFTGSLANNPGGENPNDGSQLAVRDGNVFGRVSTTAALTGDRSNDKFLDSNDTFGISWDVDLGGRAFDKILLTLTDAADTGAIVEISDNTGGFTTFNTQPRSNQKTVLVDFGSLVTAATIVFKNVNGEGELRTNDGLGIDDIAVSAVPLPASVLLLGAGLAGLGAMRRRKAAS